MMLVLLPAMDNVPGLPFVDRLPSFALPARLTSFGHHLTSPSVWLTVLATLVILSSIRAAILFLRPPPNTARKGGVSIIPGVGVVQAQKIVVNSNASKNSMNSSVVRLEKIDEKKTSSMFWGLVKWDSLPALPLPRRSAGVSMSEAERGPWQLQSQQRLLQPAQRLPRRTFEHPPPAVYQCEVPVSMAKMIMSRHTFRRPTSRPPPVRNANAPQYQRKLPSMV